jgi:hypothetical protein
MMDFGYEILRLWERPVALLASGLGTLLSIADIECLYRLCERLLDVSTWEVLLQTP